MIGIQTPVKLKKIQLVGFSSSFDEVMEDIEEHLAEYNFSNVLEPGQRKKWLKQYSNVYDKTDLPYAILCDYEYLVETNFNLLNDIQLNPLLNDIPFICFSTGDTPFNKKDGMRRGIDDYYHLPIDSVGMRKRIIFLNKYKSALKSEVIVNNELSSFKMPMFKRSFDIVFSLCVLICASPFLLIVAALIKLESKGPIVYKSKRAGYGFQIFDFLKFRSMSQDADTQIKDLAHLNKYDTATGEDGKKGPSFVKLKNDPRITRVGKFIRKFSIDELPQFINVLKGDMSIVGNRPLPLYEAEQLTNDQWSTRFLAPAGITGWWQINKQSAKNLPESERMNLDLEYAEKISLWFDMKIILKTIPAMIQKDEN